MKRTSKPKRLINETDESFYLRLEEWRVQDRAYMREYDKKRRENDPEYSF